MSSDANPALGSSHSSRSIQFHPLTNRNHLPASQNKLPTSTSTSLLSPVRDHLPAAAMSMAVSLGPTAAGESAPAVKAAEVSGLVHQLHNQFRHLLADQVTPLRLASHLSVLVVGAVILILSQVQLPDWNISLDGLPNNALGGAQAAIAPNLQQAEATNAAASEGVQDALQRAAVPFTTAQEQPRATIELYTVKAGDTVLGIAARFGIQPETIMWANTEIEQNPDRLAIGDRLNILPINGVLHVVRQGDTLSSLAAKYKVEADKIIGYSGNGLATADDQLKIGSQLVIPDGTKPFVAAQVPASFVGPAPSDAIKGSGSFSWPTSGSISQRYWGGHRAVDIGSWVGAPVKSTDSGYVVLAGGGWNGGYGNHVIIDHGNGYSSLYAHLNSIFVRPGESVSRGQQIGTVGNTGNSTGPHLHFEIRYQGVARNPLNWLP
jgi:murein DD-endopeptidase MepM/ murein hydrolase activator NlpD